MSLFALWSKSSNKPVTSNSINSKKEPKNRMLQEGKPAFIPAKNEKYEAELWDELEDEYGRLIKTEDMPMSPGEFIRATNSNPDWVPDHGYASVKRLKIRMENGKEIDKPFLVYYPNPKEKEYPEYKKEVLKRGIILGHDGRHRSFVAKKLGIEKIPVDIYCKCNSKNGCKKCKNITVNDINKAFPQGISDSAHYDLEMNMRKQFDKDYKKSEEEKKKIESIFKK